MREIKFRVFDKTKKAFIKNPNGCVMNLDGQLGEEDWAYEGVRWFEKCIHTDTDDYIIQQYTGLKDKDGVEIYEGDLLTYADNTTPEQIFEVKFLDERGTFVFRELYNPTFEGSDLPGWDDVILGQNAWDGWEIADAAKVIGNIFEGVDK